jgi:general secretion pathway protein B
MSFILDALRKSEHERERRALPGLVESPVSRQAPSTLAWVLGTFGVLLVLNAAILLYVLLRPATTSPAPVPAPAPVATVLPPPVAAAVRAGPNLAPGDPSRIRPLAAEVAAADPMQEVPEPPPVTHRVAPEPAPAIAPGRAPINGTVWPTLRQLPAAEASTLPPLNLDLHVYSSIAAQRFVIINGQRVREGGQLHEGLTVEQITPEGALLNRQGKRFVLTRE